MGPEVPGHLLIWLALGTNLLAGFGFFMSARGRGEWKTLAVRAYYAFLTFTVLAVVDLYYLFFTHNYAFKYIYQYSERSQPFEYIVSAFWGGQEGTYLLWLALCGFWGLLVMRRGGRYANYGMAFYSLVNLFLLVLLVKLSPFALMPQAAPDGLGLNQLLRDYWMVIHPPIMFTGFAATAIPFALALAAMIKNDYTDWVRRAFPWVATVALFLAAGNILGGYWAYKTLGWGGYWAWDPVENTSMVPWLTSLALLHGLIIERRSGSLRKINLLLSALLFLEVIYGTFLTRSGVLADFSVHSFTDLGINVNLIFFMGLFFAITVGVFLWRVRSIKSEPINYNFYSKEFNLVASVAVLFAFALIVLFWSSLPILSGWFSSEPRAAEIATYNRFAVPLTILMALLVTVVPIARFKDYRVEGFGKKSLTVLAATALLGFGVFYLLLDASIVFAVMFTIIVSAMVIYLFNPEFRKPFLPALILFVVTIVISLLAGVRDYLILMFYATAAMAALANLIHLVGYFPGRIKSMASPLAHFGFGIMLIGVMASSAFDSSQRVSIPRGGSATADQFGAQLGYNGMAHQLDYPNNELLITLDEGSGPREVRPQLYYSARMDGIMRRPYISRNFAYDLYLAPQQIMAGDEDDGLVMHDGDTKEVAGVKITFTGFDVVTPESGEMGGAGMSVTANLEVNNYGTVSRIGPTIRQATDESGRPAMVNEPGKIVVDGHEYDVEIAKIFADDGTVVLNIPGLTGGAPDQLVLDVSKKPMINMVWFGTTLILIGSILSIYRRRSELVKADA